MPTNPTNYAQWLPLLDRFRDGDYDVLPEMQAGSIEWSKGVTERFSRELGEVLETRLKWLTSELQKRLARARGPFEIRGALGWAQSQLPVLHRFTRLPVLEQRLAAHLDQECSQWVARTISSMQSSAQAQKTDQGETAQMLKQSPLKWPPDATISDNKNASIFDPLSSATTRRKVLL
jgi:hypothetical protein